MSDQQKIRNPTEEARLFKKTLKDITPDRKGSTIEIDTVDLHIKGTIDEAYTGAFSVKSDDGSLVLIFHDDDMIGPPAPGTTPRDESFSYEIRSADNPNGSPLRIGRSGQLKALVIESLSTPQIVSDN